MELILTTPLPDELLASYLSRLAKINGFRDQRAIWNAFNGRSDCTSFIDAEVCFPRLAEVMCGVACTAEGLVKNCTFLPAQVSLGEFGDKELLSIVAAETMPTLSQLTFMGHAALKYCERCVLDDFCTYDVPYWHRVHQIPFVKLCPIHHTELVCVQFKRADLHNNFPMPNEVSSKSTKTRVRVIYAPMLLADIPANVLAASEVGTKPDLRSAIWEELGDRRYLRRDGSLEREKLISGLLTLLGKYFSPTPAETIELRRIVSRYGVARLQQPPLGTVFLIYFLFGSWEGLRERFRWMSTFGSQYVFPFEKQKPPLHELDLGRSCRHECLDFVSRHPQGTRLEFTRKYYRAFRWLSRYDTAFLDHLLPIPVGRAKQFVLFTD